MRNLTIIALLLSSIPAFAADTATDDLNKYYTLESMEVTEVVPTAEEIYSSFLNETPATVPDANSISFDQVILIGKQVVDIMRANAAVVNIKRDAVAAVPVGITDWQQLAGWQAPVTKAYEVVFRNGFGMNVVNIRTKVSANYGGNFNGKGAYLANVILVPTSIDVWVGFNVDMWTEVRDPLNTGTNEAPVAGLGYDVRYKVTKAVPFNEQGGTYDLFLTGLGKINVVE